MDREHFSGNDIVEEKTVDLLSVNNSGRDWDSRNWEHVLTCLNPSKAEYQCIHNNKVDECMKCGIAASKKDQSSENPKKTVYTDIGRFPISWDSMRFRTSAFSSTTCFKLLDLGKVLWFPSIAQNNHKKCQKLSTKKLHNEVDVIKMNHY